MWNVNQTRPHCVNQMGKTHSKLLAVRHGWGTACYVWIRLYSAVRYQFLWILPRLLPPLPNTTPPPPRNPSSPVRNLTFICLRDTTLSYDVAHRTVRSWRQNSFDWFSRWPWNTLRNRMCVAGRSGGSFQQYFYNRYKIVVYTGLRSNCIKNHASRYKHRWR
jgi:hypothetical protein